MIWVFLLVVSLAIVLIKLGAMSVWVTVLSGALQAIFLVLGIFVAVIVWRYWRRRQSALCSRRASQAQAITTVAASTNPQTRRDS